MRLFFYINKKERVKMPKNATKTIDIKPAQRISNMPKYIFAPSMPISLGIITTVTKVMTKPAPNTINPRLTAFRDSREHMPDMMMNIAQKIG